MKKSEEKQLIKAAQHLFKRLTKTQQIIALLVVAVGFGTYYVVSKSSNHQTQQQVQQHLQQQEKVVTATNASEFLNLTWDGSDTYYVKINGGKSTFSASELTQNDKTDYWVNFSKQDQLNRANQANARLSYTQYMKVKKMKRPRIPYNPVGWYYNHRSNNQDITFHNTPVTLYNRSHLIAWMFSGDAGSPKNLVTGTRAMNSPGMQDFETKISDVLYHDKLHVRYQVTPIYQDSELLPRGIHMMAKSVEDDGKVCDINVYVFNVQPNYTLDYTTGVGTKK